MSYLQSAHQSRFIQSIARAHVLSLRVAFRINLILIALCMLAAGLYVFFIAQAVFYATASTEAHTAAQITGSKVALLEQEYLARTSAISVNIAPSLGLVEIADKQFVEKSVVSRASYTPGI